MDRKKLAQDLQSHASHAWNKFIHLYPKLVLFECPTVRLNARFTRCAGMCYMETNIIDISLKYLIYNKYHIFTNTLIHELAHQVDYNLNGWEGMRQLEGHGPNWCNIMLEYGISPDRYHTMEIPNIKLNEMLRK